jgi:hypothetical protein
LKKRGENITRGYGGGPSKKLKLIQLACRRLGILDYSHHGIKREYYLFPFASNLKAVIKGQEQPSWKNYEFGTLVESWKTRWLNKRIQHYNGYKDFNITDYIDNLHSLIKGEETNGR